MLHTRPTGLQSEIDALIAHLVSLRLRPVVAERPDEDNPADLRALAELLKDTARAIDPFFQRIAYSAGLTSMSGASGYVDLVSNFAAESLLGEITARADKIEDERVGESQAERDRRENGTISHACLGLSR
jgi:hypothetical protein